MDDVIARWESFLAKIKARFEQVMEASREGCALLFEESGGDTQAVSRAWTGMEARARDLETKVTDTFADSVQQALDQADAPAEVVAVQQDKGLALARWMERAREATGVRIFADLGRRLWAEGMAEHQGQWHCTQCGGVLAVPPTAMAVNITCSYCSAVVTFEPSARLQLAVAHVHHLAQEAAWPSWCAWQDAEEALCRAREPTLAHFTRCEATQIAYWRHYLRAQDQWLPNKQNDIEAELPGRMRHFYQRVFHEKAWVQAGRPRTIPMS